MLNVICKIRLHMGIGQHRHITNFDDSLQEPILGISKISSIARQSKLVAVTFNTKLIQNIFEHCQT